MGKLKVKGKAGAAKNFTTRSLAVKKLQCSLADFRRLCILKGIFPREPRNKKKANKGSSAPTTFYYTKDIAYLAHEPILKKLREHKAFAKKLSRALGRGEWSSAKSLEDNKPIYRLDHIIKERYPTFIDAVRDIDDALCMVFLFSSLPSDGRLPKEVVENCAKLVAEWQLYILHSKSLRKVFLSIKGAYYQAEVADQTVTWLAPYQFTQNVPADVDLRVMLTFLELYQTLLSFVFFKIYTDAGLVYPPPLDIRKDEGAAGINALTLQDSSRQPLAQQSTALAKESLSITAKEVRRTIKSINAQTTSETVDIEMAEEKPLEPEAEEEFIPHSSTKPQEAASELPTFLSLSSLPQTMSTNLFAPYTFWLSRETSRSIFEFTVRSFGGRMGWPGSSGGGSPFDETDPSITHVIMDRPVVERKNEDSAQQELRSRRKYIQPQWIIDCINAGKILLEEPYGQGKTLPPHLSPFGEYEGAYVPAHEGAGEDAAELIEEDEEEDEAEADEQSEAQDREMATAVASKDPAALRAAELAAEAAGLEYGDFEAKVKQANKKRSKKVSETSVEVAEQDMNKMMMSNKQRKLYEKMKYSQGKKNSERLKLEERKKDLLRQKRKGTS
ncbi:Pescadillo N-terminus-domain-containing protein [Crepidotus variabilis]|uniref:Pescadillo homolog n=1 Tax=Crepidotus variabilis TaxID=179855 RepID=A0A9P6JX93_9AGAR|nr:Pescadillo N-terminus-domain-containing protein [Crepidotus variabilis]